MIVPLGIAATSPLLAWREPVYIISGLAGVIGLCLLLLQPLLAAGALPGLPSQRARTVHRWLGASLVVAVIVHVAGLWLTSPPDVIDALLLRSPTPFSLWGVIAMWAVFVAATVAALRHRFRPRVWRRFHTGLAAVIVLGTSTHALLIDGTMGTASKVALCALVVAAAAKLLLSRQRWRYRG
jgi:predicted ferric reductase